MPRELAVVVPVRLSSTRLPRKHLIEAHGKPFLHWLVRRQQVGLADSSLRHIVIATTTDQADDDVVGCAADLGVACFRGEVLNVPGRLAAAARSVGADAFVCVDGDDVACSPRAVRAAADLLLAGCARVSVEGLPFGMNASGYSADLIERSLAATTRRSIQTGWGDVLGEDPVVVHLPAPPESGDFRLTLDYEADAAFFRRLIEHLGDRFVTVTDEELIASVRSRRLHELNQGLNEQYWAHYHRERTAEMSG